MTPDEADEIADKIADRIVGDVMWVGVGVCIMAVLALPVLWWLFG